MAGKRHEPEEVVAKLRQAEALAAQGKTVAEGARAVGVTEATCYRWRAGCGGLKPDQAKRLKQLEQESGRPRGAVADLALEKLVLKEAAPGNRWSAARRRARIEHAAAKLDVSERFACRVLGQHRSTQRKAPRAADDGAALTGAITDWARRHGRHGCRRIAALLRTEGWRCGHNRAERGSGGAKGPRCRRRASPSAGVCG